jgi:hypothetical protein
VNLSALGDLVSVDDHRCPAGYTNSVAKRSPSWQLRSIILKIYPLEIER